MGIDIGGFTRTQLDESSFKRYDVVIGMSDLHKQFIKLNYNRDIPLFNELYNGKEIPVNIGLPDSPDFAEQMKQLVLFFREAIPIVLRNLNDQTKLR
ncbi:hypothetical protein SD70_01625 [Gordoniibacillus kamchatkensis]|uniref:Phosphotyrosine protein phosphatase I domain-containing protein n=2 Tax=Gordoniibacillus kamchatkensis TaxID=1590651 RepID=A0ABR5AMT0_9BACL|nr:hypothetical protein SD70_01625 [Paenibacillus sp. VKM B-2647]